MKDIENVNVVLNGLSSEAVEQSKKEHGTNALTPKKVDTIWQMLLGALDDVCIKILLLALGAKIVILSLEYLFQSFTMTVM